MAQPLLASGNQSSNHMMRKLRIPEVCAVYALNHLRLRRRGWQLQKGVLQHSARDMVSVPRRKGDHRPIVGVRGLLHRCGHAYRSGHGLSLRTLMSPVLRDSSDTVSLMCGQLVGRWAGVQTFSDVG